MARTQSHTRLLQLALIGALVAMAIAHVARADDEGVTRVRVDLDLEQLGLVGEGAEGRVVELEIHCDGARPNHQIFMDGDVLVVRTEATPDGGTAESMLGVAAQRGVAISVDLAPDLTAEAAVPPVVVEAPQVVEEATPETIEQITHAALEGAPPALVEEPAPTAAEEPPLEVVYHSAPEGFEQPAPAAIEETSPRIYERPAPAPAGPPAEPVSEPAARPDNGMPPPPVEPRLLYEPTPADELGMGGGPAPAPHSPAPAATPAPDPATAAPQPVSRRAPAQTEFVIDDPEAAAEVLAALEAAIDEAHEENRERLRESGLVDEYLGTGEDGQQTSRWTAETPDP